MKSCFNSPIIITQRFGVDFKMKNGHYYYASMGIKGHDGLDVVPSNKDDKEIYNFFDGIIMKLENHNIYGNRIAIWNPKLLMTEYHCHLEYINPALKLFDHILAKTNIGLMGNTGKSFGEHDHFALSNTDPKGNRINRDNGYFGYIDPISFLMSE